MRRILTLIVCCWICMPLMSAQDVYEDYMDGVAYFKVDVNSGRDLPDWKATKDGPAKLKEFPELQEMIGDHEIERIYNPFKTPDPEIQNIYRVHFNAEKEVDQLVEKLRALSYTDYAQKKVLYEQFGGDGGYAPFATPNDIHPKQAWFIDSVDAESAWDMTKGDPNVKVAVVDDAVEVSHPDIAANVYSNPDETAGDSVDNDNNGYIDDVRGWDAADKDNDPHPPDNHPLYGFGSIFTHGTHTSGIAVGVTNNDTGIAALSHNTSLIPIKINSDDSQLPIGIEEPAAGVDYAISAGADVISMSFGGGADSVLNDMLRTAHDDSIVLVAASGNNGSSDTTYPAGLEEVISVGATSFGDSVADFSNYGTWVDVMAPGDSIYSSIVIEGDTQTWGKQSGTSMACPMAASLCGLILSESPNLTPSQVEMCLKSGAENIDDINPSYVDSMGAGRINARKSVECARNVGIEEETGQEASPLTVRPNPTQGRFYVEFGAASVREVAVYDMMGKVVMEKLVERGSNGLRLDASGLKRGVYFLKARGEDGSFTKRVTVLDE